MPKLLLFSFGNFFESRYFSFAFEGFVRIHCTQSVSACFTIVRSFASTINCTSETFLRFKQFCLKLKNWCRYRGRVSFLTTWIELRKRLVFGTWRSLKMNSLVAILLWFYSLCWSPLVTWNFLKKCLSPLFWRHRFENHEACCRDWTTALCLWAPPLSDLTSWWFHLVLPKCLLASKIVRNFLILHSVRLIVVVRICLIEFGWLFVVKCLSCLEIKSCQDVHLRSPIKLHLAIWNFNWLPYLQSLCF